MVAERYDRMRRFQSAFGLRHVLSTLLAILKTRDLSRERWQRWKTFTRKHPEVDDKEMDMEQPKEDVRGVEYRKQVQVVIDYIKSGRPSEILKSQKESVEIDPEMEAITDRIFNDCTFLR